MEYSLDIMWQNAYLFFNPVVLDLIAMLSSLNNCTTVHRVSDVMKMPT